MLTANCSDTWRQKIQDKSIPLDIKYKVQCMYYQKLRGAQEIESKWLDPRVVDAKLSVNTRALYAGQDAQIGGKPCWIWGAQVRNGTWNHLPYECLQ